jgi:hypothetical protein
LTILECGSAAKLGFKRVIRLQRDDKLFIEFSGWANEVLKEEPMSNQHSVTKRHRRPKSDKRADYTARTMAAVKQLEKAAKEKTK